MVRSSPFLMGTVRAGLLSVESPFQGSESHSRAARMPQPGKGWTWGSGQLAHHSPKGWT